jgi:hypothetical protein
MNVTHRLILMLTMLSLGGCGEFAYKTGAGADVLAADQQACKQAATYRACMHDKGWTIADLGDDTPATAPVAAGPASVQPSPGQPSTPGAVPSATPTGAPVPAETPPAPVVDPLAPVKTTAWIKFGAGSPHDDIEACVATLGPGNAPDTVNKTVTRALLTCMRQKGWRGL